jgi:hypothetical protein
LLGTWTYSGSVPDLVNVTLTFKADKTLAFVEQIAPASEPAGSMDDGCVTTDAFSATYVEIAVGDVHTLHWALTSGTTNVVTGCKAASYDSSGSPLTEDDLSSYITQGTVLPTTVTYTTTATTLRLTSTTGDGLGGSNGTTFTKAVATDGAAGASGADESGAAGADESGAAGADESGAAGANGEAGELTCAEPTQSGCPGGLIPYSGQKADPVNHCRLPAVVLSCSAGASAAQTCWVNTDTSDLYLLDEIPCKPDAKWQDCSQAQSDSLDALPLCK